MGIIKLFVRISSIVLILSTTYVSQARPAKEPHQDFIDEHNKARAEVGVGPIKWNETVAAYAQKYADSKIETCEMNLASGDGMTGAAVTKYWVTEKEFYDYQQNKCFRDECGHYLGVIWGKTTYVRCSISKCKNGQNYVISNYNPSYQDDERPY
ncbi:basic form of pathogenesis-related protein 1-like [Pyrus ussuriensis x Pyrus communis]|uniref:Basic form of pathogenesis-related protein 1-like n=1 Tax=Pyrus ussuriensis x Pyrus communis TaxID=2448454 RepID=A0A5N5FKN0_9ROSA|nr:basic form of pathogenesis-related protein 1-like [Pyrus ussuriensis x Pyrus communis]